MKAFTIIIASSMMFIVSLYGYTSASKTTANSEDNGAHRHIIMCWNLENYFDTFDDPATNDEDFNFGGKYRWSRQKFQRKRNSIAKTIISVGSFHNELPSIIGLEEVENRMVLKQLISDTPLAKLDYDIIHRDSPDKRGIDVALLYRKSRFKPLKVNTINLNDIASPTRDILYVKGILSKQEIQGKTTSTKDLQGDTIHIFVNHWPSKLGGEQAEARRRELATKLVHQTDSLGYSENIIIMGDFNDTPREISKYLIYPISNDTTINKKDCQPKQGAAIDSTASSKTSLHSQTSDTLHPNLINLAEALADNKLGTLKYRGIWELIDQFIVSGTISACSTMSIYSPDFLLEEDKPYLGKKPRRTHIGPRYNGGVSDHLPILLTIRYIQ